MDSYILCTTPRSGSTLLCDLLTATGLAGAPDSFFMPDPAPEWRRAWGLPGAPGPDAAAFARATLAAAIKAGRGATPIFGLRLMQADLPRLTGLINDARPGPAQDKARLEGAFGRTVFVHLSRTDKLAQAVSRVRAEQSGLWHIAPDGRALERLSPPAALRYDAARIAAVLADITAADAAWQSWFNAEAITPLALTYETLAASPAKAVNAILAALGLPAPASPAQPATGRLADATSAAWLRRFRAETGG